MASGDLIFDDPFTEASTDTELNSHTPSVGASWTRIHQIGSETIKARAATDDARATTNGLSKGATYTADGTYPSADYHVVSTFVGVTTASGDEQRLYIRYSSQGSNGYYAISVINSTASAMLLVKGATATTETTLKSLEYDNDPFVDGVSVVFEAVGSDIAVYANEICYEFYLSDSSVTAAGKGALGMGAHWADTSGDTNTGMINDNFQVVQLGANNTGWLSPTTTGEVSNDFTNPSNAYSSNDVDATRVISAASTWYSQDYGDFGINTGGANATGIQVFVEWADSDATGPLPEIRIELSKDNGATWPVSKTSIPYSPLVITDVVFIFGHARSLWGTTFTSTELNDSNFRIRVSVRDTTTGDTFSIDHIKVRVFYDAPAVSAAITGTITPSSNEASIVAGGKTIIITLTGDTWVAAGATFDAQRQAIIDGLDAATSPAGGWNLEVRDNANVTDVVRTSGTVVTVTLEAFASYDISATETITVTVPAAAVTGAAPITGSPTFTITPTSAGNQNLPLLGIGS